MNFNTKLIEDIKNESSGHIIIAPLDKSYKEAEEVRIAFGAKDFHFEFYYFYSYSSYSNYYLTFRAEHKSGLSNNLPSISVKELLLNKEIKW